jgi:hypothetical protein
MAKNKRRSNREPKKPKQVKTAPAAASSFVSRLSAGGAAQPRKKK